MSQPVKINAWVSINEGETQVGNMAFFSTKKEAERAWGNNQKIAKCEITVKMTNT